MTLNWYVFPEPSGSFQAAATNCSAASGGKYTIKINLLSTSSDQQRVSLVRRLAAGDSSIDILAMDVDWTAEFATAKWIRPVPAALAAQIRRTDLAGPVETATWQGRCGQSRSTPTPNCCGIARTSATSTSPSDDMDADAPGRRHARQAGKPHYIEEQGAQYEGLTCGSTRWSTPPAVNRHPHKPGRRLGQTAQTAAAIMHELATSPAADPSLNVDSGGSGGHRV